MGKNIVIGALIVAVGVLFYIHYWPLAGQPVKNSVTATTTEPQICAQVITPARDPQTGTIKEFPTPCDVPNGWEVVQNDVPGLDLEVQ